MPSYHEKQIQIHKNKYKGDDFLRKLIRNGGLFYYRTKSGKEVAFVVPQQKRAKTLIQVCETLKSPQTEKREVSALQEAMRELNLKSSIIVTRNEEKQIAVEAGTISVIPVWRFLLER